MLNDMIEMGKCMEEEKNKFVFNSLLDNKFGETKPEMVLVCIPNNPTLIFNSVNLAEEAFVKKNNMFTREQAVKA